MFRTYIPSWRFFAALGLCVVLFVLSYIVPALFPAARAVLLLVVAAGLADAVLLSGKNKVEAKRQVGSRLSMGDLNTIYIVLRHHFRFRIRMTVVDEAPVEWQLRHLQLNCKLDPNTVHKCRYIVRPVERGAFLFGSIRIRCSSALGLVIRQVDVRQRFSCAVYPSVIQMKQYKLQVFSRTSRQEGIRHMRRLGHNNEFEQIKAYVQGDDIRTINWKATSRRSELMVNQYQEERAQQVYCVLDKSRSMHMPFEGMTLLDYSINTALVMSNIVLTKSDRAGLISFGNRLDSRIRAEAGTRQLQKIMESLYRQKTNYLEADFEKLYHGIRRYVKGRSLLLLFTNFESTHALKRALPMLRLINKMHVLVCIFFRNRGVEDCSQMPVRTISDIYTRTIAETTLLEKKVISGMLKQHAIQSIITDPEQLSIDAINKYLELKSRGVI